MDQITENSNRKNSISLSRNTPVALVVGAASFLGSHLVDRLLEKGIQIVGIDDLKKGKRQNLHKATENKDFHLLIESPERLEIDLPRLDYIFIVPTEEAGLKRVLDIAEKYTCRCLLVSSIDLYDKEKQGSAGLRWLKEVEKEVARFASEHKLNARIVRLGSVYGPRMEFAGKDPIVKLIQQALTDSLQKDVTLEFSSRALYISDAVDLLIKTMLAGSTAQKIFDGVELDPIKVAEIKQVLLDPIWYETRDFAPTPLPPWPTPNLEKTVQFLNWRPKSKLVAGLRHTLSYFKDNEIEVPEIEVSGFKDQADVALEKVEPEKEALGEEKKKLLEELKPEKKEGTPKAKNKILTRLSVPLSKIYLVLLISLVTYALIWPSLLLGWGILTFRSQLSAGLKSLQEGEFEQGLQSIKQAEEGVEIAKSVFEIAQPIKSTGLLKQEFETGERILTLSNLSITSAKSTILGTRALLQSLKAVTGELNESPGEYFDEAQAELSAATEDLSKASAILKNENFTKNLPQILAFRVAGISEKLGSYTDLANKAQTMSILLPKLVAMDGSRSYLILLQNNMELRPAGGFIGSFAKVSLEGGKLKKLDVNDIYTIDGQLGIQVEPPKEIKTDLGQNYWYLRDSNWEPDFPTSARQAEWFYTKETGERVEGVIALDISAMEDLLSNIGSLELPDYKEKITIENLFERAISYAELSFFPGSQAKKSFLTALTNELFNKMFFLPQQNFWPKIVSSLGKSLEEKHISVYLNDPKDFSFILSQNWAQAMPRQSAQNEDNDFLSLVEANLGANKVNYYLERAYNLETVVGKYGEVKHRLRVNYTNRSPSDTFPGGKYKNRMRVYLPFGSALTRVLWGETDITKEATSFVDYGRSGYSLLLELAPKEQKTLVLDYTVPIKLDFKDSRANYRLDVVKQAGTLKDPFKWTITYPLSYKVVSGQTKVIGPQEHTISTDLSKDRSFEVQFSK
ncbi:DUF4012 domain-containing protein [Candidatus Daviesbacteria bacterium]|nr:DUF4012 domain-containing protein [Candidatus Daviesbacteria bacterium]